MYNLYLDTMIFKEKNVLIQFIDSLRLQKHIMQIKEGFVVAPSSFPNNVVSKVQYDEAASCEEEHEKFSIYPSQKSRQFEAKLYHLPLLS